MSTLSTYILRMAEYGNRPAFIEQGAYRSKEYNYARVLERALAVSNWLRSSCLEGKTGKEPPRIVLQAVPSARWAMAFYGCVLAGVTVVPVDAGFSSEFLDRVYDRSGASLFITDRLDRDGSKQSKPGNKVLQQLHLDDIEDLPPSAGGHELAPQDRDALVEIVYTSGTTAEPRGVMITQGNLMANLEPIEREAKKYEKYAIPFQPIRFVHLIPLSHLFGQVMALFIPQLIRGVVIFPQSQSPVALARTIKSHRASVMVSVPQQLQAMGNWAKGRLAGNGYKDPEALIRQAADEQWSIPKRWWKFRHIHNQLGWKMWAFVVGGAVLPADVEQLWNRLGYAVVQGYGLTETAPAITITHPFKIRRGAVGKSLPGVETRIAEDGEILVRGANVSPGYYRDTEATQQVFEGGWLHTGDLGRFDKNGNLIYLGRKKDVIVTAEGLNVYPDDVEDLLRDRAPIREAAVVGKNVNISPAPAAGPGTIGRTVVHAVLVPRPGATPEELETAVQEANARLEPYQRVRGFSVWPEAELPRTVSTKKLQRARVAAWVNEGGPDEKPSDSRAEESQGWRGFLSTLGIPNERIEPDARLAEDLGLSSLDRVEFLAWLEGRGYSFDEQELAHAQTIGDIERIIQVPASNAPSLSGRAPSRTEGVEQPFKAHEMPHGSAPKAARQAEPEWPLYLPAAIGRELSQRLLAFPLLRYYVRTEVRGLEKLRQVRGPVLFVSNHQSLIDPPVILKSLPRRFRRRIAPAMGEAALRGHSKWALFWTRLVFNVYLISDDPSRAQEALRHAGWLADRGYSTLLFPEGERTLDGRLLPFQRGVGVMVEKLRLPVVPLMIKGLFEVWPRTRQRPVQGKVNMWIGDLIRIAPEESASEFTHRLEDIYSSWWSREDVRGAS